MFELLKDDIESGINPRGGNLSLFSIRLCRCQKIDRRDNKVVFI